MSISMHSASAPIFARQLGQMLTWLDKAEAHAAARGFPGANFLQQRLAVDMLPFVVQIRIASDTVKAAMARLAGVPVPSWEDNEATLDELRSRIRRTLDFVNGFAADQIDGSEARIVEVPRRDKEPLRLAGEDYLKHYALPNFFFHCVTAYALLRQAGVQLGKGDYLGSF